MTDYSVDFLGCKVSQTDAEAIRDALAAAGHAESATANVRVVNACCITGEAEKKSRKKVRQLLRAADADGVEDVRVFVTGCGATLRPGSYDDLDGRVTALPGAATLAAATIVRAADQLRDLGCKGAPSTSAASQRTRAFVKVQDGCSFECSYCIVPTVRGDTRSRAVEAVLTDVRRRVAMGQREIVLTGVNIGLYRDPESRIGLHALLPLVADVEGVARVRISSIEVNHVNKRLVAAMADHPKVCHHLHVPLQSGDDGVLARMRRHYRSAGYLKAIQHAREVLPDLNLSTDVIVGFPGEDDAAFTNTLALAREAGFTKVHAFPFSPRPGTDGEEYDGAAPVAPAVKQARSLALREQADAFARARWQARVGSRDEVVVERRFGGTGATLTAAPEERGGRGTGIGGYTRDYCPVRLDGPGTEPLASGDIVAVELVAAGDDGLVARLT